MPIEIPNNLTDCLYWIKERTERYWSLIEDEDDAHYWAKDAKWEGLTDEEIDQLEIKYGIEFSNDHRLFLKILHHINRKEVMYRDDEVEGEIVKCEYYFFFNWKKDEEEIRFRMNWPADTIFSDVKGQNQVWLKSWGKIHPKSNERKKEIFDAWFAQLPPLIPINGHRFVVGGPLASVSPVLSVYGSDIIVYGWNIAHYLINELGPHLNLGVHTFDEEDNYWYFEDLPEVLEYKIKEYKKGAPIEIPVIEEMILYWSSGWRSYGKERPKEEQGTIQPILKTFIAEDEEGEEDNPQKTFTPYSSQ